MKNASPTTALLFMAGESGWGNLLVTLIKERKKSVKIIEVEDFQTAYRNLAEFPCGYFIGELLSCRWKEAVAFAVRVKEHFPNAKTLFFSPELQTLNLPDSWKTVFLFMQTGAIAVVRSQRELLEMLPGIERHFGRFSPRRRSFSEEVWENLPQIGYGQDSEAKS